MGIKITKLISKIPVYDITVEKNHNFFANDILVHNCTEIMLPSDNENSFVCDLGSMNDFYYEEWKDTDCVKVLTFLLDAAMTEFIEKASKVKFLSRAVSFSKKHRALGIGRLGYHSLLQSKMIPFESLEARNLNIAIQKNIQENSIKASQELANMFGECEMTRGTGRRNTTTQAIAPTTSSAFIMQVSQSIEPWMTNYMIKDLSKGKFVIKNTFLEKLLEEKGFNTDEIWESIQKQQGSVLHLDCLTEEEKLVFKTAREISQSEIITQAAQRQKYIDQGQSLNLFITADTTAKEVNTLMLQAHEMGIKSLYYQHNTSGASTFAKNFNCCVSCE
jgi:ribonucleoside-diphosphate reductase alpha chain